ncbi:GNAT family N-acetyltransferase [Puniceicoccaceae bacterium K14]|nr:GNAT family N-acetyltransferase [Puniceicoccaceae bacterium K14]
MPIDLISENSWNDISRIQEEAYREVPAEEMSCLKKKWISSPGTCLIYTTNESSVCAYLLSHPWAGEEPPTLNDNSPIGVGSSTLFLHDLAVSSSSQGKGIARTMVESLILKARSIGFIKIRLVAVQSSDLFWGSFGFKEVISVTIDSNYGDSAKLMELTI